MRILSHVGFEWALYFGCCTECKSLLRVLYRVAGERMSNPYIVSHIRHCLETEYKKYKLPFPKNSHGGESECINFLAEEHEIEMQRI